METSCNGNQNQPEDEFTTECEIQEKVTIWKIKNFTKVLEARCFQTNKITLQLSVGKLELRFLTEDWGDDYIELAFLSNPKDSSGSGKRVFGSISASIKDPNSDTPIITSPNHPMKDFNENGGCVWGEYVTPNQLKTAGALVDDTLVIHIMVKTCGEIVQRNTSRPPDTFKQNALDEMTKHFADLLETGEGSDFVIRIKKVDVDAEDEHIEKKVHRAILSARNPVFKAMLESQMSEKETGVVTIEDMTPKGLDVLLEYIYTGNISDDWKLVPAEVLNVAEKYEFPLLKTYCNDWLHVACTTDNAFTLLNFANTHGLREASTNIAQFIKSDLDNLLSKF